MQLDKTISLASPKKFSSDWSQAISTVRQQLYQASLVLVGSSIAALSYVLFQIPYDLAAGGVTGLGIIISNYTGWSAGILYLILNIPILILGFYHLGRWTFLARTLVAVLWFSFATELLLAYLPTYLQQFPITEDVLLGAVYAGLAGGIGGGIVYRAGATMAGTGVIGRILQFRTGIPLSQIYLYTDGFIVLLAGLIFGWEIALYAILTLMLSGLASDYVLEGSSRARTATIVTQNSQQMVDALTNRLERGVSYWEAVGGYSGEQRTVIMCTVYRPQVMELKRVVTETDPQAFVSIGVTQEVLGSGFTFRHTKPD